MKILNKSLDPVRAFTLLELIIVIIIIGVLASLAIPRMTAVVERARIVEGVGFLMSMRSFMERCYLMNNQNYSPCVFGGQNYTDMQKLTKGPNSHFDLHAAEVIVSPGDEGYMLIIMRNSNEIGGNVDPGGLNGCTPGVVDTYPRSTLSLCVNYGAAAINGVQVRGAGFYEGYNSKF